MDPKLANESIYESFRWLEDNETLDLRLFLDDYHTNLRRDVPQASKPLRQPSFRRHLSMSKLPFSRSSISSSRPGTNDPINAQRSASAMEGSFQGHQGHGRRKSRTISLMSGNKSNPDSTPTFDAAATHYRDPDARSKLREYLASPLKFDEAIEFGFPSIEEQHKGDKLSRRNESKRGAYDGPEKLGTFLDDDDNSIYSDEASATDLDSPKTPDLIDHSAITPSPRVSPEPLPLGSNDFNPATGASREMTLRMTLTRSDLRAHEEDLYGWKMGPRSRIHVREMSMSPLPQIRQGNASQAAIERQFAALDFEHATSHDTGVVRRFWNRVRRG